MHDECMRATRWMLDAVEFLTGSLLDLAQHMCRLNHATKVTVIKLQCICL